MTVDSETTGSITVLGASGSLRAASSNTGLVRLAARLAPDDMVFVEAPRLDVLPFYDADLDTPDALPTAVAEWRARVEAADALWLAVPEYNWGPSAVMKNAIDWLTRPLGSHTLRGKVLSLVTSGGGGGGTRVQAQLGEILALLGNTMVTDPQVAIANGAQYLRADGTCDDPAVAEMVAERLLAVRNAVLATR
jgi:chromate reductase, NAD(P)H dehydrogenase (quinone)